MALHQMTGLTPHLREADLQRLAGHTVLGEPLPVLMSAALRMRFTPTGRGVSHVECTVTDEEGDALQRAMARVEAPAALSLVEQDAHRLVLVLTQTCRAADAVVRSLLARPA
jgi:hypothetical protein